MNIEKRLSKHLKRLNKSIQKLVAKDPDFGDLRDLLRKEKVELAIYVVPLIGGEPAVEDMNFRLTDSDRLFLKKAGIKF
jgi:hypothetical protein